MGLRPSHGTWQFVDDPEHPPAFTPAEAAQRLPIEAWQRTIRWDSHGKELVRSIAELELGTAYGPTQGVRLIAATLDPTKLTPESTWFLVTSLPLREASPEQVYELYRLRDWIEHYYKPAKHELGWADYQVRPERAIVRHWHLVMLAFTFSLLLGAHPPTGSLLPAGIPTVSPPSSLAEDGAAGGKIGPIRPDARLRVRQARHLERHVTLRQDVALSLGADPTVLDTVVLRRPAARTGRAARPRRSLPSPGSACFPNLTNQR